MSVKYQIFISSTFEDLKNEREQVVRAVLEMGHIPVGMEMFSAADEEQWQIISRQIALSDYYVVIVAHRYGSTDGKISFTEKEYDFAVSKGIPVLAFVLFEGALWPADKIDKDLGACEALLRFKSKLRQRYISHWGTSQELYGAVPIALMKQMTANPRIGWIRANEVAGPEATAELARLSKENADLRRNLSEIKRASIENKKVEKDKIIRTLENNKVALHFWYKDAKDWAPPTSITLYAIFRLLGPDLMVEKDTSAASSFVGKMLRPDLKKDVRESHPIPRNTFQSILADLSTLGLVEPSRRRHSARDANEYWTLTDAGREVLQEIRRMRLEAGLGEAEEASKKKPTPEVGDNKPQKS